MTLATADTVRQKLRRFVPTAVPTCTLPGVWVDETFHYGSGDRTWWVHNLDVGPEIGVHREDAESVVIVEGRNTVRTTSDNAERPSPRNGIETMHTKADIRERVWDNLDESGVARFPFPPHGRIPNFAGARDAAERLADRPEWRAATTVKANPDAPQLPVRRHALRAGKTVYVAIPRLREVECFLELDPDAIAPEEYDDATTVSGASKHGVPMGPDEVPEIDLIVSGSVAVSSAGTRIGKGEGYSDLEFAVLSEVGRVNDETTVATTVHERQIVDEPIETASHDVPLDLIVTPDRVVRPDDAGRITTPAGIDWDLLDDERIAEIPVLQCLRN